METLRIGLSYYRHTEDLQLEELVYKGKQNSFHYFHDQYHAEIKLSDYDAKQLNLSRIMCLNDLEEKLRFRINYVHDQLRRAKQQFNPVGAVDKIMVSSNNTKEVHQYDKKTGKYIQSYPSAVSATKYLTGKDKLSGDISNVINGRRMSAYGYRWSSERLPNLPRIDTSSMRKSKYS